MTIEQVLDQQRPMILTAARIVMGLAFVVFGLTKLLAIDGTIRFIGNYLPMPQVVFWLAIVIEVGLGLALIVGFKARCAALLLAAYCVFIAFVFHFAPTDRAQRDQFLKNLLIAAGFMLIAAGETTTRRAS